MAAFRRYSLPPTDFSFMLYDVAVVYGGLMLKACGLQAWEDAGLLMVDALYPDYWRSWPVYGNEWDAYEKASRNVVSVPVPVIDLIKISTMFNSCTNAIELRSNNVGCPLGLQDVINALIYKTFESVGYGFAAIYAHVQDSSFETDKVVFGGFLISLAHDVFDYARDCYEWNHSNSCMIMHGLNEDVFLVGCAVLFAVWNSLDQFDNETAHFFKFCISILVSGNLSIVRYCGMEQLVNCTTSGEWSMNVKATAINIIKNMASVSICWPENVALTTIGNATYADYHRTAVTCLYESTAEHVADLCIKWANQIINSTMFRDRTISYVKRIDVTRGTWA